MLKTQLETQFETNPLKSYLFLTSHHVNYLLAYGQQFFLSDLQIMKIKSQQALNSKSNRLVTALVGFGISLFSSSLSFASEIRVLDCEGNLRASTEVQAGETRGVKVLLSEINENAKAKLSKVDSDSALEARAAKNSLVFGSIDNGDWKLCNENRESLAFNSVEFIEGESENLRLASLTAAAAAVVSGVAIAASDSDGNNQNQVNFDSTQPNRATQEAPSSLQPGNSNRPKDEIIVSSRCAGKKQPSLMAATGDSCREDEAAPVISPYD